MSIVYMYIFTYVFFCYINPVSTKDDTKITE